MNDPKQITVVLSISWPNHLFLFLDYDQCFIKWVCGTWHDLFPRSAAGWGNLPRYLGYHLTVFNLKQEIGWKKMMLSPIMNRPTKLDGQFSPTVRHMVTAPLPFQGVSSQDAAFCFSIWMVASAIPREGTVREHLGWCPGWYMRPSLAFSAVF